MTLNDAWLKPARAHLQPEATKPDSSSIFDFINPLQNLAIKIVKNPDNLKLGDQYLWKLRRFGKKGMEQNNERAEYFVFVNNFRQV